MSLDLQEFRPDQRKRETGILVELFKKGDQLAGRVVKKVGDLPTVLLARTNDDNPRFAKAHERAMRPYREAKDKGDLTPEEEGQLLSKCLTVAITEGAVLGWHNMKVNGVVLEFSVAAAKELLADIPDIQTVLWLAGGANRNFRVDMPAPVEADAKNS